MMRLTGKSTVFATLFSVLCAPDAALSAEDAALQCWWHWMGGEVDRGGIVKDLDAMQRAGIGVAHIFCTNGKAPLVEASPKMFDPEWFDLLSFTFQEAAKRGVEIGFHNCPGWSSSGGPWIKPEDAMKFLVASATDVSPSDKTARLSQPVTNCGFYRDVVVLAFPLPDGAPKYAVMNFEGRDLFAKGRIEWSGNGREWEDVGKFTFDFYNCLNTPQIVKIEPRTGGTYRPVFEERTVPSYARKDFKLVSFSTVPCEMTENLTEATATSIYMRYPKFAADGSGGISPADIVDLTAALSPDGRVDLAALGERKTRYRVLRFGYTCTGKLNHPAPEHLVGLDCDKLSRRGLDAHWPHMPGRYLELPGAREALKWCTIDSYEVGGSNWTDDFEEQFRMRRGYDILRYLPAVVGYRVGTAEETANFLMDLQRTVADLFRDNYYGYFAELCRRNGLRSCVEPANSVSDFQDAMTDVFMPMGEFWADEWRYPKERGCNIGGILRVRSAAHLSGNPIVGAEAFTSYRDAARWQTTPESLKELSGWAWAFGLTRIVYHSYVFQGDKTTPPGASIRNIGTQLNRHTTWWPEMRVFADYVRRVQTLLSEGHARAEVLMVSNECNPNWAAGDLLGNGFDIDVASLRHLKTLTVENGKIVAPGGARYDTLWTGRAPRMSAAVLREILRLKRAGARVFGSRPASTLTLKDDMKDWKGLADAIWDKETPRGEDIRAILAGFGVKLKVPPGLLAIRREMQEGEETVFLYNRSDSKTFAGEVDGMKLELPPHESIFLKRSASGSRFYDPVADRDVAGVSRWRELFDCSTDWTATFDGLGAPKGTVAFPSLSSWHLSGDPALKYFSGRAVYRKTVRPGKGIVKRNETYLDLGDVRDVVNVRFNGRHAGTLWCKPYRIMLPDWLADVPEFSLELEVVNTWPNRFIGDLRARKSHDVPDAGTWTNFTDAWKPEDALRPAGLLGPIRFLAPRRCLTRLSTMWGGRFNSKLVEDGRKRIFQKFGQKGSGTPSKARQN